MSQDFCERNRPLIFVRWHLYYSKSSLILCDRPEDGKIDEDRILLQPEKTFHDWVALRRELVIPQKTLTLGRLLLECWYSFALGPKEHFIGVSRNGGPAWMDQAKLC